MNYSVLAFAALCESAIRTHQLATGETVAAADHLLAPVFTQADTDLEQIFAAPHAYRRGVEFAKGLLRGEISSPQAARYVVQLLQIANSLRGNRGVTTKLRTLLDETSLTEHTEARAAFVYENSISTLGRRIHVTGEPVALNRRETVEAIRAALLCGVRFAWLWHQLGGRRWHLMLRRKAMLLALDSIDETVH